MYAIKLTVKLKIKTSFYELESLNPQIASIYPEKDNFEEKESSPVVAPVEQEQKEEIKKSRY